MLPFVNVGATTYHAGVSRTAGDTWSGLLMTVTPAIGLIQILTWRCTVFSSVVNSISYLLHYVRLYLPYLVAISPDGNSLMKV